MTLDIKVIKHKIPKIIDIKIKKFGNKRHKAMKIIVSVPSTNPDV